MAESQRNVLDTFVYEEPRAAIPVWYVEDGLVGREALLSHFQPGRGAAVAWRMESQAETRGPARGSRPCFS